MKCGYEIPRQVVLQKYASTTGDKTDSCVGWSLHFQMWCHLYKFYLYPNPSGCASFKFHKKFGKTTPETYLLLKEEFRRKCLLYTSSEWVKGFWDGPDNFEDDSWPGFTLPIKNGSNNKKKSVIWSPGKYLCKCSNYMNWQWIRQFYTTFLTWKKCVRN